MKILIKLLIIFYLTACMGQKKIHTKNSGLEFNEIKEIWIYDYFETQGWRTSSAYRKFEDFEKENLKKIKIKDYDFYSLVNIIEKSKEKKLFPTKLGMDLIFAIIINKNDEIFKVVICVNIIQDFSSGKDYWIYNEEHHKWIADFKERIRGK